MKSRRQKEKKTETGAHLLLLIANKRWNMDHPTNPHPASRLPPPASHLPPPAHRPAWPRQRRAGRTPSRSSRRQRPSPSALRPSESQSRAPAPTASSPRGPATGSRPPSHRASGGRPRSWLLVRQSRRRSREGLRSELGGGDAGSGEGWYRWWLPWRWRREQTGRGEPKRQMRRAKNRWKMKTERNNHQSTTRTLYFHKRSDRTQNATITSRRQRPPTLMSAVIARCSFGLIHCASNSGHVIHSRSKHCDTYLYSAGRLSYLSPLSSRQGAATWWRPHKMHWTASKMDYVCFTCKTLSLQ